MSTAANITPASSKSIKIGDVVGMLTVIERAPRHPKKKLWVCRCECGNTVTKSGEHILSLKSGCGCKIFAVRSKSKTVHGHKGSRTYRSWTGMKSRCLNPNDPYFHFYGGAGVAVCPTWVDSFEQFLLDMGERPEGHTLDRIRTEGNYEKGNCKWSTTTEQNRNRSDNHYIELNGEKKCLSAWCEEYGAVYSLVQQRIRKAGWDPFKALTTPARA